MWTHLQIITGTYLPETEWELKSMCQSIATLQKEGQEKDVKMRDLENEVSELKTIIDNHEQHGRRDSIRIFGLSEETSGTTDDKVMRLCNCRMKLDPPLTLDEISVSHRVGRIVEPTDDFPPPPKTAAGQVCYTTLKKVLWQWKRPFALRGSRWNQDYTNKMMSMQLNNHRGHSPAMTKTAIIWRMAPKFIWLMTSPEPGQNWHFKLVKKGTKGK